MRSFDRREFVKTSGSLAGASVFGSLPAIPPCVLPSSAREGIEFLVKAWRFDGREMQDRVFQSLRKKSSEKYSLFVIREWKASDFNQLVRSEARKSFEHASELCREVKMLRRDEELLGSALEELTTVNSALLRQREEAVRATIYPALKNLLAQNPSYEASLYREIKRIQENSPNFRFVGLLYMIDDINKGGPLLPSEREELYELIHLYGHDSMPQFPRGDDSKVLAAQFKALESFTMLDTELHYPRPRQIYSDLYHSRLANFLKASGFSAETFGYDIENFLDYWHNDSSPFHNLEERIVSKAVESVLELSRGPHPLQNEESAEFSVYDLRMHCNELNLSPATLIDITDRTTDEMLQRYFRLSLNQFYERVGIKPRQGVRESQGLSRFEQDIPWPTDTKGNDYY